MDQNDVAIISDLVMKRTGLVLSTDKTYLVESRLSPLARKKGFETLDAMIRQMKASRDDRLAWDIAEAMTTNETFFFRDNTPFDNFKDHVLPYLCRTRPAGKPIRVWSAACSSGQEPYSLAMLWEEAAAVTKGRALEIVATDICSAVLSKAEAGTYSQFEVQRGLPIRMLTRYFEKQGDSWRISPSLKRHITFKRGNLLESFTSMGSFDLIFCRNVLIYFNQQTKSDVLNRLRMQLPNDGFLLLGAAETTLSLTDKFENVKDRRGLYQPKGAQAAGVRAA
jgi:chemotaxis protein methyltransferase CheR